MNSSPSSLIKLIEDLLPERLKLLKSLVEENSLTTNVAGVGRVIGIIEDSFWALGLKTERFPCATRADILVAKTLCADDRKPILLAAHADTVHAQSTEYRHLRQNGDILTGPGVFDMKAGIMQIFLVLDALKALNLLNTIPLRILMNSSEENSTEQTQEHIRQIAQGAAAALVFEMGRDGGGIVLERKGIIELWCESQGKESHSGNGFDQGVNAILPLCRIAQKAAMMNGDAANLTVNVSQFFGGSHFCVVPGRARLAIEMRASTSERLEAALVRVQELVAEEQGVVVTIDTMTPPLNKTAESEQLYERFASVAKTVGFETKALSRVGGLSDANLIGAAGVPTIDALGPEGANAHTRDEFVRLSTVIPRAAAVVKFLTEYN